MLAYAANNRPAGGSGSPKALVLVLAGHAVAIAAVLTARPEIIDQIVDKPPTIFNVPIKPPPPPPPQPTVEPQQPAPAQESFIEPAAPIIDMGQPVTSFELDKGPAIADIGAVIGSGPTAVIDPPRHVPVKIAVRFNTPADDIKPPYPASKRRLGEEATLRLKLSIDTRGRVVAVEPVGAADAEFLSAARRHILKSWRYKPATEDGVAVHSSTVITLSFRLEEDA